MWLADTGSVSAARAWTSVGTVRGISPWSFRWAATGGGIGCGVAGSRRVPPRNKPGDTCSAATSIRPRRWSQLASGWIFRLEMRQNLSFSTRRLYTQHVRDYLKPYLGSVPLRSLTVARVQAMFAALIRTNTSRTRPLALRDAAAHPRDSACRAQRCDLPWAARAEPGTLDRASLRTPAARCGVDRRPGSALAPDRRTSSRGCLDCDADCGVPGEQLRPSDACAVPACRAAWAAAGEAAGLRWCDIDLDARVLQLSHQVQDHNGRTVVCPPKPRAASASSHWTAFR